MKRNLLSLSLSLFLSWPSLPPSLPLFASSSPLSWFLSILWEEEETPTVECWNCRQRAPETATATNPNGYSYYDYHLLFIVLVYQDEMLIRELIALLDYLNERDRTGIGFVSRRLKTKRKKNRSSKHCMPIKKQRNTIADRWIQTIHYRPASIQTERSPVSGWNPKF